MDFSFLEEELGFDFKNKDLYTTAFTHASYAYEQKKNCDNNERLEYLGDAVLELVVSNFLYKKFPNMKEGELTKSRSRLVCESSLAEFAKKLNLDKYVRLGKGEDLTGGRNRSSLLADLFEAFVGAIYLDQGIEAVEKFLNKTVFSHIDENWLNSQLDTKSYLQEIVQKKKLGSIKYKIVDSVGPAHDIQFVSHVYLNNLLLGKGRGKSKKEAEQMAAAKALKKVEKNILEFERKILNYNYKSNKKLKKKSIKSKK